MDGLKVIEFQYIGLLNIGEKWKRTVQLKLEIQHLHYYTSRSSQLNGPIRWNIYDEETLWSHLFLYCQDRVTPNTVCTEFSQCMMEGQLFLRMQRPKNSVLLYLSNLNKVSFRFCYNCSLISWACDINLKTLIS